MTNLNNETIYLHALMIAKLTGELSEEETLFLKFYIDNNVNVKEEWDRLSNKFPAAVISQYESRNWMKAALIIAIPPVK